MDLEMIRKAYLVFQKENKVRKDLIKATLNNNQEEIIRYQRRFGKLYDITNNEIYPILNKLSFKEIDDFISKMIDDPKYHELTGFFILLLSYHMLAFSKNDVTKKLSEDKDLMYYKLVTWYTLNHAISKKQIDNVAEELGETTLGSVGIRNVLANREELNIIFDDIKLNNEKERDLYVQFFVKEVNLFIQLLGPMAFMASNPFGPEVEVPKSLLLRLVLLNILTRKYSMGFSIEEYINRYLDHHNVIGEAVGIPDLPLGNEILKPYLDDYLMEINDITNEFMNQKKK